MTFKTIALDYDSTYTLAPQAWNLAIEAWKGANLHPFIVTMRFKNEPLIGLVPSIPIIYTGRLAKTSFMLKLGHRFDVWIDDSPHFLFMDAYEEHRHSPGVNIFHHPDHDEHRTTKEEWEEMFYELKEEIYREDQRKLNAPL